ncbi:MAG: polysaccharide biosynthesis C-terminal domain-containing protein [Saprospiraceae bacterium]|nr:polysaccharide biosynthesis C-terminal domain-containing protein [Saprospiraceae bacterium]
MRHLFSGNIGTTRALQLFQLMRLASVILTSILLAKSGLSTAEIGTYEMLLYIGTSMTFFWVNGLLMGMSPVYASLGDTDRKAFVFNNFLVFCGIAFAVFLLLFFGEKMLTPLLTGQAEVPYFRLFSLYLLLHLPTLPVEYIYLLKEKPRHIVVWGMATFGLHVVALYLPVWLGYGLRGGFMALILLSVLKLLWTLRLVLVSGSMQWRSDLVRHYLGFSAPLTLNVLVGNFIILFDAWLVGWHFKDETTFAIFRYGSREFPLATALASALATSAIPLLADDFSSGLALLKSQARQLMHLVFPLTLALLFLSQPLFPWVFNPDFAASAPLFNIYLLITASRVLLPNAIVLAKGDPHLVLGVGFVELLVKIALGLFFIQHWGLVGVAWSAVLAFWVEKLGLMWLLRKKYGLHIEQWLDIRWYLVYVSLLCVAYMATIL